MVLNRRLLRLSSLHLTQWRNTSNLSPVDLSYTSYENTETPTKKESPPFIIMHGLFGSKSNWNSMCKALHQRTQPQRKIIAVDARNHGDSPHSDHHTYRHLSEDLRHLYARLGIKRAALLGHSMGGRAVMYFALKYPESVERLIVGDISPVTTSDSLYTMPRLIVALREVRMPDGGVSMPDARLHVDRQLARSVDDKAVRAFLLTNLVRKDMRYDWRINIDVLAANFEHIARFPELDVNDRYDGPTLFIAGTLSDYLKKKDEPKIRQIFPNAKFHYIEGAGHWLHSEKPNEFLQKTVDFLNGAT